MGIFDNGVNNDDLYGGIIYFSLLPTHFEVFLGFYVHVHFPFKPVFLNKSRPSVNKCLAPSYKCTLCSNPNFAFFVP